jgi:hypothetical protein
MHPAPAPVVVRPIALTEAHRHSRTGAGAPPGRPDKTPPPPPPRSGPTPPPPMSAPPVAAPKQKPDEGGPRSRPPGNNKPTKLTGAETQPIELLEVRRPERRGSTRPMPAVAAPPEAAVPPRRFAKGTSPNGTTSVGVTPAPARTTDGDYTTPGLSLGDYTTPDLSIGDRTQPGLAIGSVRATATRPVAIPSLRGRPAR